MLLFVVCKESALGKDVLTGKQVSSELIAAYGVKNINDSQTVPWVGNFTYPEKKSKSLWVELDFKSKITVPYISMKGSYVSGFRPGQSNKEKCYLTRFVLEYKTASNGQWIEHRFMSKDNTMVYYVSIAGTTVKYPSLSYNITHHPEWNE